MKCFFLTASKKSNPKDDEEKKNAQFEDKNEPRSTPFPAFFHSTLEELRNSSNEKEVFIGSVFRSILTAKLAYSKPFDESILVIGNTGSGKTSFCHFLSGSPIIVKKNDVGGLYYDSKNGTEIRKIGHSIESETIYPNKFICQDGTLLWDCPGFSDSRGAEMEILQAYHINSIAKNSKKLKILVMIEAEVLEHPQFGSKRGLDFKELFEVLQILTKVRSFNRSKNISIMFSKATKDVEFYKKRMNKLYELLMNPEGSFSSRIKKFFSSNEIKTFFQDLEKAQCELFMKPTSRTIDENLAKKILGFLKEKSEFCSAELNIPFPLKILENIIEIWKFSRAKFSEYFMEFCNELSRILDFIAFNRIMLIYEKFVKKNLKSNKSGPIENRDFLKLLKEELILKFIKLAGEERIDMKLVEKYMSLMEFFGSEIYDRLLLNVRISDEANAYFGKLGETELLPGINILKEKITEIEDSENETQLLKGDNEKSIMFKSQEVLQSNVTTEKIVQIHKLKEEIRGQIHNQNKETQKNQQEEIEKLKIYKKDETFQKKSGKCAKIL